MKETKTKLLKEDKVGTFNIFTLDIHCEKQRKGREISIKWFERIIIDGESSAKGIAWTTNS